MAGTSVHCIIIGKFRHWKKSDPVVLLIVYKSSEIGLNCTILHLNLVIYLEAKGSRESLFNLQEMA